MDIAILSPSSWCRACQEVLRRISLEGTLAVSFFSLNWKILKNLSVHENLKKSSNWKISILGEKMNAFHHKSVVKSSKFSRLRRATPKPRVSIQFTVRFASCLGGNAARRAAIFVGSKNLSVREKAKKNHCLTPPENHFLKNLSVRENMKKCSNWKIVILEGKMKVFHHKSVVKSSKFSRLRRATPKPRVSILFTV